jgi:hypothetical protein
MSIEREKTQGTSSERVKQSAEHPALDRRKILLGGSTLAAVSAIGSPSTVAQAQQQTTPPSGGRPNIRVIFGDDIGQTNISAYSFGVMGYRTPNIDRVAKEGSRFTQHCGERRTS